MWIAGQFITGERFELWSGVNTIQLSPQLQIKYGRFHNIHDMESTCHWYLFGHLVDTSAWMLHPLSVPMCSAILKFREHVWRSLHSPTYSDQSPIGVLGLRPNSDWNICQPNWQVPSTFCPSPVRPSPMKFRSECRTVLGLSVHRIPIGLRLK